nr:tRNA lysidine(34) synthetase TilS [Azospirillum sp. B4]
MEAAGGKTGESGGTAVDDALFARLMAPLGPFETAPVLAVGVSGGRDSLALTLLAHRWAQARGGRIQAFTVDHALRPESAAEAAQVARWLAARGIDHAILTWEGPKPATGLQAAARQARYALLAAACRERGILHLCLAHHREDQAETVALRRKGAVVPTGWPAWRRCAPWPTCACCAPCCPCPAPTSAPPARLSACPGSTIPPT